MKDIGLEMDQSTSAFSLARFGYTSPSVLDMCMAPGAFLAIVLDLNPTTQALAFSLPPEKGGLKVLLPSNPNVEIHFLDITMLATEMGVVDFPAEHSDCKDFLAKRFAHEQSFDLVFCDGQVLRTHERASYRDMERESRRLLFTQLALGLDHVKLGGTMVILLHRLEAPDTVSLLYTFSRFSSIELFKHKSKRGTRSSFYMVATNIERQCQEVELAISKWKDAWKIATFGTDKEYKEVCRTGASEVENVFESFGPELVRLGRDIWRIQAEALERAAFIK